MNVPWNFCSNRKALTSWLKHHLAVLQGACANAFKTKDHPEKGLDHLFLIQLEPAVPMLREHITVKPQLQIKRTSLVNHVYLCTKCTGVVGMFTQQKEADAIRG
jgi:hypothetical protein